MRPNPVAVRCLLVTKLHRPHRIGAGFEQFAGRMVGGGVLAQRGDRKPISRVELHQPIKIDQHAQDERVAGFPDTSQDRGLSPKAGDQLDREKDRIGLAIERGKPVLRGEARRAFRAADDAVIDQLLNGTLAAGLTDPHMLFDGLGRPFRQLMIASGACEQDQVSGDEVQPVRGFQRPELWPKDAVQREEEPAPALSALQLFLRFSHTATPKPASDTFFHSTSSAL
jgi:hypothetical protein